MMGSKTVAVNINESEIANAKKRRRASLSASKPDNSAKRHKTTNKRLDDYIVDITIGHKDELNDQNDFRIHNY